MPRRAPHGCRMRTAGDGGRMPRAGWWRKLWQPTGWGPPPAVDRTELDRQIGLAEVAEQCEVVFCSLPTPADVELVALGADGVLAGFKKGSVLFDLSTNSPTVVRAIHAKFAEKGVHMMDAPVSGGPKGAATGKLAIWVGGDKEIFDKHKHVLDGMSDQARYVGPIGAGSVAKLVHN